jgi:peptidoglycan hydrolase-like protein with peptidoglycan-binding domain
LNFDLDAASSSFSAVYLNRHRVLTAKSSRDFKIKEDKPLRLFILAFSVFAILVSANVAKAGPSTTNRDLLASTDPATLVDEATQETEDLVGLDKGKRRDVQRRLTSLGFDTKINGRFDKATRAVITRWQAARGYPKTGFLNTPQHQALQTESVSSARASLGTNLGSRDRSDDDRPARRGGGSRHRSGGGPGGLIGGVVGGLFGRR